MGFKLAAPRNWEAEVSLTPVAVSRQYGGYMSNYLPIKYSFGKSETDNNPEQCEAIDFFSFEGAVLNAEGAYICAAMAEDQAQPRRFLPINFSGAGVLGVLKFLDDYQGFAYPATDHTQAAPHFCALLALTRETDPAEGIALGEAVQAMIDRELGASEVKFDESVYRAEQPLCAPSKGAQQTYSFDGPMLDVDKVLLDDPEQPVDDELERILADAPAVMKAYMKWQMDNAFRVHPTFALFSVLLFIQAFIGRNVRLPRDLRPNLWMLLFAPTESGKGAAIRLAAEALKQLEAKKIFAAVAHFTNRFGSLEGMLWQLSKTPQVVWVNEEMVKMLTSLMAAQPGTSQYNMAAVLMELHDAATNPYMAPIQYSGHDTRTKAMPPLEYPFFAAIGTGVTNAIGNLSAAAVVDGSLNRFLSFVVEGLPPIGKCQPITPLPAEVVNWAQGIQTKKLVKFFDPDLSVEARSTSEPQVLKVYPAFEKDWKRENEYGAQLAQDLPGIWGRYAEKVLQVAMLYAVVDSDSMAITPEGFAWAKRLVHWAVTTFAKKFESEGGGAADLTGKVRNALLAFFKHDKAVWFYNKHGYLSSGFIAQFCRPWRDHPKERPTVVKALVDEGLIVEIDIPAGGTGYYLRKTGSCQLKLKV